MSEEELYPDEYQRRKENMRPDALVIPEDVLILMRIPRKKITKGTITKEDWTSEEKTKAQECITCAQNKLYPNESVDTVPLVFHQEVADRITALAAVYYSTTDKERIRLLEEIISNSQISARTNYQFVRHFIRRSLYPILKTKNINIPQSWLASLTLNQQRQCYKSKKPKMPDWLPILEKSAKQVSDAITSGLKAGIEEGTKTTTKMFIVGSAALLVGYIGYLKLEDMGFSLKDIIELILEIAKGEFEHYDEIKDVLEDIKQADPSVEIYALKGRKIGWEYVSTGLKKRGIACSAWEPDSPRIRYYAFPVSHMLLFSLGDGQFLAFSGGEAKAVQATRELFQHDTENLVIKV